MYEKVKGFDDYEIDENGNVYSLKTNKKMKQYLQKGYYGIYLYKNKKRHFKLVHRLVAETYIPNPNNLPQINHKDENSKNNNVNNLEWCTAKYNSNYGHHKEKIRKTMLENNPFKNKKHSEESRKRMSEAKMGKESKRKRAVMINGKEYKSITEAMQQLKISTRRIYKIIKEVA